MSRNEQNLFTHVGIELDKYTKDSNLTVLSMGLGQDSITILFKLIFDSEFRKQYAPNELLVLFANTHSEHEFTIEYRDEIIIPLCKKHNIEFVSIENDKGFHGTNWLSLQHQWTHKRPTITSLAFKSKSCTHNLKIQPQFNFLGNRIAKQLGINGGNKKEFIEYAKRFGKIRNLIGISKLEEKRVLGGKFYIIDMDNNKIIGKSQVKKEIEYFNINGELFEIILNGSDKEINYNGSKVIIKFEYKVEHTEKWKLASVQTEYPLIDIGYDRKACQDYIKSLGFRMVMPSNCLFCHFGATHLEILWMHLNLEEDFYRWAKHEENKLKYFENKNKFIINCDCTSSKIIKMDIESFNKGPIEFLKGLLEKAINENSKIELSCLNYQMIDEVEELIKNNKKIKKEKIKNLGVVGKLKKDGSPFTLVDLLNEAKEKYPDITMEELQRQKENHGTCIESMY